MEAAAAAAAGAKIIACQHPEAAARVADESAPELD
jgi:hypothetical protein